MPRKKRATLTRAKTATVDDIVNDGGEDCQAPNARLVPILSGSKTILTLEIEEGKEYTVGRDADCSICVDGKYISLRHFTMKWPIGSTFATITDTSENGTFLNGIRLPTRTAQPLHHGDEISLVMPSRRKRCVRGEDFPSFLFQDLTRPVTPVPGPSATTQPLSATPIDAAASPGISSTSSQELATSTLPPAATPDHVSSLPVVSAAPPSSSSASPLPCNTQTLPPPQPHGAAAADGSSAALEEELTCGICAGILYKSVSTLPCLHTFCAPCLSDWHKRVCVGHSKSFAFSRVLRVRTVGQLPAVPPAGA